MKKKESQEQIQENFTIFFVERKDSNVAGLIVYAIDKYNDRLTCIYKCLIADNPTFCNI